MDTRIIKLILLIVIIFSRTEIFSQSDPDFYFYPTPSELFDVIDKEKLAYDNTLVNPIENEQKYVISTSKYLNLGVYISDLAYSAFFLKKAQCFDYLVTITNLSDVLLISPQLKKDFNDDVISNSDNMDSVYYITNDYYYDVMLELDKNNSKNALYIITTGAYIEAFYIALNLTGSYSENNKLLNEIAQQKAALLNLNKFSKLCVGENSFPEIIMYQEAIIRIFNKFLIEPGTPRTFVRTKGGGIKFVGGPKITMNKEQFEELKTTINNIRAGITN